MLAVECLQLRRGRRVREPASVEKELFDAAGGLIRNHQSARFSYIGKRVGHLARSKQAIAGSQLERLVSNPKHKLALADEEPFVLIVVEVQRRATLAGSERIVDTQIAAGIPSRDFAIKPSVKIKQAFAKPISVCGNLKRFGWSLRRHPCPGVHG